MEWFGIDRVELGRFGVGKNWEGLCRVELARFDNFTEIFEAILVRVELARFGNFTEIFGLILLFITLSSIWWHPSLKITRYIHMTSNY